MTISSPILHGGHNLPHKDKESINDKLEDINFGFLSHFSQTEFQKMNLEFKF